MLRELPLAVPSTRLGVKVALVLMGQKKPPHIINPVCDRHIRQGGQYVIFIASGGAAVEDREHTGVRLPADAAPNPLAQFDEHIRYDAFRQVAVKIIMEGAFIFRYRVGSGERQTYHHQ